MDTLPSGTVTFLFTDIEGSTKLAQQYPDDMPVLLARHHEILRQVIQAQNGYIFQNEGDSLAVAFHSPMDALNAASNAQKMLQSEDWSPAPIKVRMGIHIGAAKLNEMSIPTVYTGYTTLAMAARVMSAGHGGQILLSSATHELIRNSLPENIELVDLGEKRLKDLLRPERLYQLNIPGLQKSFPPLKTLDVSLTNLPTQLSTFIGREREVEQVKKLLEKNRLVTLTGSGGVGKTRLSIQVASELLEAYPNGVWLVELAPITDPAFVSQTVCATLEVTPPSNPSALNVLMDYLHSKKILLVVDNCEHLIDACAQLCEALLHACPNLRIIASSREALGIDGESAYRVPSLSLPNPNDGLSTIEKSEAVKLFVERATATLPEFKMIEANASTIAQICQRLDGIALALELAASRVKLLKVEQIASRLNDAFRLLTGGSRTALPRQQTLRALIDWSYNLLSEEERTVLQRLSIFMGGWTLEAAEYICDNPNMLDLLTHLVDKSLVAVDLEHGDEPRYYLLETIRQYAREKLNDSNEGQSIRARHLDYFLRLVQREEHKIYGTGQVEWLQQLEDEHANLNAALEWSIQENGIAGQHLATSLFWSWHLQGAFDEGYNWLLKMLQLNSNAETLLRAKMLYAAGELAYMAGYSSAAYLLKESETLYTKLGDEAGRAFTLIPLGYLATNLDDAFNFFNESLDLHKRSGNKWGARMALTSLGGVAQDKGDLDRAWKAYEDGLAIAKEIEDADGISFSLWNMAGLAEQQGDHSKAEKMYREALQYARGISNPVTMMALESLATAAVRDQEYEKSKELYEEALEINRRMGDQIGIARSLRYLGWMTRLQSDYVKARSIYSESLQLSHRIQHNDGISATLLHVGNLMLIQGSPAKFVCLLGAAERAVPKIRNAVLPAFGIETEEFIEKVRTALGDGAYTAAYEAGQQMSLDQAVTYALKELRQ